MKIQIVAGTGTGPTTLAAFDSALIDIGVANYNLIPLSSVVPPGSEIITKRKITTPPEHWGHRLYVVMAGERVDTPNMEAWAGIGWVQEKKSGKGLFVEHHGASESAVRKDITDSLNALMESRNGTFTKSKINMSVAGITCTSEPVCALALAVYQAVDWGSQPVGGIDGENSKNLRIGPISVDF